MISRLFSTPMLRLNFVSTKRNSTSVIKRFMKQSADAIGTFFCKTSSSIVSRRCVACICETVSETSSSISKRRFLRSQSESSLSSSSQQQETQNEFQRYREDAIRSRQAFNQTKEKAQLFYQKAKGFFFRTFQVNSTSSGVSISTTGQSEASSATNYSDVKLNPNINNNSLVENAKVSKDDFTFKPPSSYNVNPEANAGVFHRISRFLESQSNQELPLALDGVLAFHGSLQSQSPTSNHLIRVTNLPGKPLEGHHGHLAVHSTGYFVYTATDGTTHLLAYPPALFVLTHALKIPNEKLTAYINTIVISINNDLYLKNKPQCMALEGRNVQPNDLLAAENVPNVPLQAFAEEEAGKALEVRCNPYIMGIIDKIESKIPKNL